VLIRIVIGIFSVISFVAAILIVAFSNRLESTLAHIWADLLGQKLSGRKPSRQPYIIWLGFFICICLGSFSVMMGAILDVPTNANAQPAITVVIPTNYVVPANAIATPTFDFSKNPNLAVGKEGYASSVETFHYASRAFDGDPNTAWSSEFSDGQWIYVDLGEIYNIEQVKITWERAYGQAYTIDLSDNELFWETVYTQSNGSPDVAVIPISGRGRYVRMAGIKRGTDWGFSIWEFEVYGTP
jgi:hypothetical protein